MSVVLSVLTPDWALHVSDAGDGSRTFLVRRDNGAGQRALIVR